MTDAYGVVNDPLATALQENGIGWAIGLSVADLAVTADAIGITPADVTIGYWGCVTLRSWRPASQSRENTPG